MSMYTFQALTPLE